MRKTDELTALTNPLPRVARVTRPVVIAAMVCAICAAVLALSLVATPAAKAATSTLTEASSAVEAYSKKDVYGAKYGKLVGDDEVQKSWPGLTCDRTDDDKWDWGEPTGTADNSGTNCVYGDSWFCVQHFQTVNDTYGIVMDSVSELLWRVTPPKIFSRHVVRYGGHATVISAHEMLPAMPPPLECHGVFYSYTSPHPLPRSAIRA